MRRPALRLALSIALILAAASPAAAGQFTVTMAPGQSVTMGDPIDTLTFTVTNVDNNGYINRVEFQFVGSEYYVEWDTVAPPNWYVDQFNNNSVRFRTTSNPDRIPPNGGTLTFSVRIKGPGWVNIPSANNDTTDTLNRVRCWGTEGWSPTGGYPSWPRRSLAVTMVAAPAAVGIGEAFLLDMQVENRSLTAKNGVTASPSPPLPVYTGGAAVTLTGGPTYLPSPLNLAAGAQGTISFTYRADSPGTVTFSGGAVAPSATSKTVSSNQVVISPLALIASESPTSVITGQSTTVTLEVFNTGVVSTYTGPATTLSANVNPVATTIPVADTSAFAASGTIVLEDEQITCTGTDAFNFLGCTRGVNGTTAAPHSTGDWVNDLDGTIEVAGTGSFPATGSVYMESEEIAYTGLTPASLTGCTRGINGTTAVSHPAATPVRSSVAFGSLTPSLTPLGTAVKTPVTPITPSVIPSLSPGMSGTFQRDYQITGTVGQTFFFDGQVTANGPVASNVARTGTGTIGAYSVTVSPDNVASGATNVTFTYTFYNGGGTNAIGQINHYFPDNSWESRYQSASAACPNWQVSKQNGYVRFRANNSGAQIPVGGNCTFSVTFSSVPPVTNDTDYTFYSDLYRRFGGFLFLGTVQSHVTVTANSLALGHAPAGPLPADGTATYTMTAVLTDALGAPLPGRTVVFSTTAGSLAPTTAVTDGTGSAVAVLTAPVSAVNINGSVIAAYLNTEGSDTVAFTGVTIPNLQYVGGTLDPQVVCTGTAYTFTLDVTNFGTAAMNLSTASSFSFTDGAATLTAYLDAPVAVAVGATQSLSFGSPAAGGGGGGVTVDPAFVPASYAPSLGLVDGGTPAYNQTRPVSDSVAVTACTPAVTPVTIIRWREVIR